MPSRSPFGGRRGLLRPESLADSLPGLLLASLAESAGFLSLLPAGAAGTKAAGCGAISGAALADGPGRGQSLVVWAIREGRQAAHAVDKFLMGSTLLPR